jgi:LacI family transcriptional regulator
MAVRLQDIAKDLNLSAMTISKVLRGQVGVSSETTARVLKRARELKYRPNLTARSLRTGQTRTIGMVVPQIERGLPPGLIGEVRETLSKADYSLILALTAGEEESEERESQLHLDRQVGGLLFWVREDAAELPQALGQSGTPTVLIGNRPLRSTALSVSLREQDAGSLAARFLLKKRSRRIAYLRGARNAVGDQRLSGFLAAMRSAHLPVNRRWIVELGLGGRDFATARDAATRLFSGPIVPDGIACCSDVAAAGVCAAARLAGLNVPEQVQVIGLGNMTEICEAFSLTTVDLGGSEMGRRAARMVLRLIQQEGDARMKSSTLSPLIVVRGSTRA